MPQGGESPGSTRAILKRGARQERRLKSTLVRRNVEATAAQIGGQSWKLGGGRRTRVRAPAQLIPCESLCLSLWSLCPREPGTAEMQNDIPSNPRRSGRLKRFLPPINTPRYHLLLAAVAIFVLGPLGGISAAYMNFSLGFFIGGQVLAGILGSVVTVGYGPEGKHGANYMQAMAASVAGLSGMAVLIQAMVWLGLPQPPAWQMMLYLMCIGMFGVGVGMLYTPILVDRMQLTFPSGFAVANILRALTDTSLLRRSVAKLGGGALGGFFGGMASAKIPPIEQSGINISTVGAGMIVGARITIPAYLVSLIGKLLEPKLRAIGWLEADAPFRKIGFIIALGTILGAAVVDMALIGYETVRRLREKKAAAAGPAEDWKKVNMFLLVVWVACWGVAVIVLATSVLRQPVPFVALAVGLVFLFVMINGLSQGVSDTNPISSAFVVCVFIMAAVGLKDPGVGLMCAAILLISCTAGVDMQQDRSTGWRLGTNRVIQFRYQVIGVVMGAVLAVVLAKTFLSAYPVLQIDKFSNAHVEGALRWQSTMTYKFVGALRSITNPKPQTMHALFLGIAIGLVTEAIRKIVKSRRAYQRFVQGGPAGRSTDFVLDSVVLPSPYASSFGGFFDPLPVFWYALGGVTGSLLDEAQKRSNRREAKPMEGEVPADMSTTSLIGGGMIAGDSLAALSLGIAGLLQTLLRKGG